MLYIEIYTVEYADGQQGIRYAPFPQTLEVGDLVIVEDNFSDMAVAKITTKMTCRKDSAEYAFVLAVADGQPKRVLYKLSSIDYSAEDFKNVHTEKEAQENVD